MDILLAQDDAALRARWRLALQAAGHRVLPAPVAARARRMLLVHRVDAVVVDLDGGAAGGLATAAMAGWRNPDCAIVVVTGQALFARGELFALVPGMAAVLHKPIQPHDLVATVEHHAPCARLPVARGGSELEEIAAVTPGRR